MTLDILDRLNIPNAYRMFDGAFKNIPNPPYAIWYIDSETFSGSDDIWLSKSEEVTIELYTAKKDIALEHSLEHIIPANDIQKSEYYLFAEELYILTYKYTMIEKRRF